MKRNIKPAIVPTLLSSQGTLWCVLLVGYFLALIWVYDLNGKIREMKAELAKPCVTTVSTPLTTVSLPAGWEEYSVNGDLIEMRKRRGQRVPCVVLSATRTPANAYRPLDQNPSLLLKSADAVMTGIFKEDKALAVLGSFVGLVRPGCPAICTMLDIGEYNTGAGVFFYHGDVQYAIVGAWDDPDVKSRDEIEGYLFGIAAHMTLPDRRESINRSLIDSNKLEPQRVRKVLEFVERELALWQLYRDRAKVQPEAYLVQAIVHYRQAIEQLSAIREENRMLNDEDHRVYLKLLGARAKVVREWFVRLDKLMAMRDFSAAKEQAKFIVDHATLVDEALDRRRAQDTLAQLGGVQ